MRGAQAVGMKSNPLLLVAAALSLGGPIIHAESASNQLPASAELGRAFVTIPYSELRALWEAGQAGKAQAEKREEVPPFPSVVQSADLELQLGDRGSTLL